MAFFFISHPILARGHCNSIHEPIGSRTHIQWPRANIECDINILCHDSYILYLQKNNIKETLKMSYDAWLLSTYWSMFTCINVPVSLHQLFVYHVDIEVICWRLTQTSKFSDANRTLRHNSRWLTEWGVK